MQQKIEFSFGRPVKICSTLGIDHELNLRTQIKVPGITSHSKP